MRIRKRSFFVIIFLILLCIPKDVSAMDKGISMKNMPTAEQQIFLKNIDIRKVYTQPNERGITCFDVNESGLIAIGTEDGNEKTVSIYTLSGTFQYAYMFLNSGDIGVQWSGDNLIIYYIRSDVAVKVSPSGDVEDIFEIENTGEYGDYLRNVIYSKKKVVGENQYILKNDMGIFNIFATSYSQLLSIDKDGNSSLLYDANSSQLIRIIVGVVLILTFLGIVLVVLARNVIKMSKLQKNQNENNKKYIQKSN